MLRNDKLPSIVYHVRFNATKFIDAHMPRIFASIVNSYWIARVVSAPYLLV